MKAMKVNELREELDARKINSKGLKSQLVGRLQKAVKEEQEKEVADAEKAKEDETIDKKTKLRTKTGKHLFCCSILARDCILKRGKHPKIKFDLELYDFVISKLVSHN